MIIGSFPVGRMRKHPRVFLWAVDMPWVSGHGEIIAAIGHGGKRSSVRMSCGGGG